MSDVPIDADFDDWMDEKSSGARSASWARWPAEIGEEIKRAVERNDACPDRRIPVAALIERWQDKYGFRVSRDTVRKYCRVVLERRGYLER